MPLIAEQTSSVEPSNSHSSVRSDSSGLHNLSYNVYSSVKPGYYRGVLVAVKVLQKTAVLLTREDHVELKIVSTKCWGFIVRLQLSVHNAMIIFVSTQGW